MWLASQIWLFLMSATGSLAHRKVVPKIFSFATKHAFLKIMHAVGRIYCLTILYGSHGIAFCSMKLEWFSGTKRFPIPDLDS